MLRSILLKTMRDQRWPALAWGLGLGLLLLATAAGWARAYPDAASRELFARQVTSGLSAVQAFYGEPHRIDQLGGFVEWRGLALFPVLLGLFMVIAATGLSRGAEERGETEVVLTAARGRARMFAEQAGGLALALAGVGALIWLVLLLCGAAAGEETLSPGRAALAVLNVGLGAALAGAFALLVAQFVRTRRAAGLIAGSAMIAAHVWNNLGVVVSGLEGARPLSPLYLVSRSTPLADGHVDLHALALLALLTLGCTVLAGRLFAGRDVGAVVRLPVPSVVARRLGDGGSRGRRSTWLLGSSLARGLRGTLGAAVAWGVGLAAYAALFAALTPAARRAIADQAGPQEFLDRLGRGGLTTEAGFLAVGLFTLLPVLVTLFAVTLATGFAAEERAGRLELELTCPLPRRRYFVERAGAALLAVLVVVTLAGAGFLGAAGLVGVHLPWGLALAAVLLLLPLAGVVAAFGYAVCAWRPGPVTPILAALLAAAYFLDLLAPLFSLPEAVRDLSIFRLYGQPLIDGVRWGGLVMMLALIAACIALGSAAFARRDIVK